MSKFPFRPVQGPEAKINAHNIEDGYVYYATDSGKIFLDTNGKRIAMGGSGVAIYYGNAGSLTENADKTYDFPKDALEETDKFPKENDLILNLEDGKFYKVEKVKDNSFECSLVLSGGGGGEGAVKRPKITIGSSPSVTVNGQPVRIYFTPTSAKDSDGTILDNVLNVSWSVRIDTGDPSNKGVEYDSSTNVIQMNSGEEGYIDITLRNSAKSIISITVSGNNHDASKTVEIGPILSSELSLSHTSNFSATTKYDVDSNVTLECQAIGNLYKILAFSFDGEEIGEISLSPNDDVKQSFDVPANLRTHGYHTVKIELFFNSSNNVDNPVRDKDIQVKPLEYEIAIKDNNNPTPIIWLGNYSQSYYNYDTISIPYMVYNPTSQGKAIVHFKINNAELSYSPITVDTSSDKFLYWEITDTSIGPKTCEITCDKTTRQFIFQVDQDPNRKMELAMQSSLKFNFDPAGRTNSESAANRQTYINNGIGINFKDFNWYNNGWMQGSNGQTCLKISNGASISIPLGDIVFDTNVAGSQAHSFEIQLKVSNVQKYTNLIKNLTRYKYYKDGITGDGIPMIDDDELYKKFNAQDIYDNYDAFLKTELSAKEYDTLEFRFVEKILNFNNIVCQFMNTDDSSNAVGFCIGTQDTFFSNGTNTVNVSFVEEDVINLSYVYDKTLGMLFIYINGVITGVVKNTKGRFDIANTELIISSNNCDVELYKLRMYNQALDVNSICINYAVDRKNVLIYDQLNLAVSNNAIGEYQLDKKSIDTYNENHIRSNYTMPYIIFDTSGNEGKTNLLPSSKVAAPINAVVEFVNVPLDNAYKNGDLEQIVKNENLIDESTTDRTAIEEAVKTYYKYHCPSFTSKVSDRLRPFTISDDNDDLIERISLTLQGTSSQFYPRKNFKGKTKCTADVWNEKTQEYEKTKLLNIYMNKGPYAAEYNKAVSDCTSDLESYKKNTYGKESFRLKDGWYLDNYTNPTDRWTFKVDYMESSGSYNAGFANMVSQAYTKHPLQDYIKVFEPSDKAKKENEKITVNDLLKSPLTQVGLNWSDYRTSMEGFPVMAFHKRSKDEYVFIGYYRMLLDKGSDQVLGFKPNKNIESSLVKNAKGKKMAVSKLAECWEYSTNNRTYCSFKDPDNRVQLSFTRTPGADSEFTAKKSLNIADNFEYRYNDNEDYIDYLTSFSDQTADTLEPTFAEMRKAFGLSEADYPTPTDTTSDAEARKAGKMLTYFYRNWEKACQWVWSTNLDVVASQGSYEKVKVGEAIYETGKYYIKSADDSYILSNEVFDEDENYYRFDATEAETSKQYKVVHLCGNTDTLYAPNKFYQKMTDTVYSLITDNSFDSTIQDYYVFRTKSNEEIAKTSDRLMKQASGVYNPAEEYYTFNSEAKVCTAAEKVPTGAYQKVEVPNEESFNAGLYYVPTSVVYNGKEYLYDTLEYRSAKFTNELKDHFDLEYLATYFVMTEFFECYDSRGKNCMMASWGPQKEGGDYIWYPIFYDIDTQLGINNSGIPSFTFNVDATEDGNYSTSDSILWNNFYTFFKKSEILSKYQQLRGFDSKYSKLPNAPLADVNTIEKYYEFDPTVLSSSKPRIECQGVRPLIATNLDMYYKYITITNQKAIDNGFGVTNADGSWQKVDNGTYYYALQGDRQQSRRQFLTNRMEYIDSWLNQGNYARTGENHIRGRIAANDISGTKYSDTYLAPNGDVDYWVDGKPYGTKKHKFDGEYWVSLSPIYSTYTTLGADADYVYPSEKYDGIKPVDFEISEIKDGIMKSPNYPEQLLYIYGMKAMSDVGDIYNLYWAEFFMSGSFPKLRSLRLGYDGPADTDGRTWFNKGFKTLSLAEMPLLKDINLSNIQFTNEAAIDLQASEKLENFRALGAGNISQVKFAKAVALNTLYLPTSVSNLELTEAKLLNKLITKQADITITENDSGLTATPGLYIQGFFNEGEGDIFDETKSAASKINTIDLINDALRYGSFKILKRFYNIRKSSTAKPALRMQGVNWCPYDIVSSGATYNTENADNYYLLNNHYEFEEYVYTTEEKFNEDVNSNRLYLDSGDYRLEYDLIDDSVFEMLKDLQSSGKFKGITEGATPEISGIIYIKNETPIKESDVYALQDAYPELTFVLKNVEKDCYTARFLYYDKDTGAENYVKFISESITKPSIQKIKRTDYIDGMQFTSPWTLYNPQKSHYDLEGWSTDRNATKDSDGLQKTEGQEWTVKINKDVYDYTYYAIFNIHSYINTFYNYDGQTIVEVKEIPYGEPITTPVEMPYRPWESDTIEDLYKAYDFLGYSTSKNGSKVNVEALISEGDRDFYAIFTTRADIRTVVHEDWFDYEKRTITLDSSWMDNSQNPWISNPSDRVPQPAINSATGYFVKPKTSKILQGKITLPSTYKNEKVIGISSNFMNNNTQKITHIFCEKENSSIYYISENAFDGSTHLEYFDFTPNTVRQIHGGAFRNCTNMSPELIAEYPLSSKLYYVGEQCFSGAFRQATSPITFKVPGELRYVDRAGLCYIINSNGNTLQLGDKTTPSKVCYNYAAMTDPSSTREKFVGNINVGNVPTFTNIVIYTKQYSSIEDKVGKWAYTSTEWGEDAYLYQYFVPNGDTDLSLYNFDVERIG